MSPELDKKLCAEFPEIFCDRNGNMQQTLMCWGFDCGDGWYGIIRFLCNQLMKDYRHAKHSYEHCLKMINKVDKTAWNESLYSIYTLENLEKRKAALDNCIIPRAVQVKEKYGTLRFYVDRCYEMHDNYISTVEELSAYVCEECGTMQEVHTFNLGWIRTLCIACAKKYYGPQEVENFLQLGPNEF